MILRWRMCAAEWPHWLKIQLNPAITMNIPWRANGRRLRLASGVEIEHLVFIEHAFFTPKGGIDSSTSQRSPP